MTLTAEKPQVGSPDGSRFDSWPRHQKALLLGLLLSACLLVLIAAGELALRIYHRVASRSEPPAVASRERAGRVIYHPTLGWIPNSGQFSRRGWTFQVGASSLRSNGRPVPAGSRTILAVGDSFTFGDEVEDGETWAAHLEATLNTRVLNAGVGAYGIDQAVLRAELLFEEYRPDVVILSFIADDIARTEYSYYPYGRGWKPYFELADGSLQLRNVPVPEQPAPLPWPTLRRALGHSQLAGFILSRIAPRWWGNRPRIERIHSDGERVSVALLARLDSLTTARGGRFVAIALATNGRIGSNARLPAVVAGARAKGIQVWDLSTETLKRPKDALQSLFRPGGHYSAAMNRWVAERIAALLQASGLAGKAN